MLTTTKKSMVRAISPTMSLVQETVKYHEKYERERNAPKQFEVEQFAQTERLSKRLSRMGVCSRRQAERLIEQGMVKVDGVKIDSNVQVNDKK